MHWMQVHEISWIMVCGSWTSFFLTLVLASGLKRTEFSSLQIPNEPFGMYVCKLISLFSLNWIEQHNIYVECIKKRLYYIKKKWLGVAMISQDNNGVDSPTTLDFKLVNTPLKMKTPNTKTIKPTSSNQENESQPKWTAIIQVRIVL